MKSIENEKSSGIDLSALRRSYTGDGLKEENLPKHPIQLLESWFREALHSEVIEPNAMALATVRSDGSPDVRTVLLKEIESDSVTFYTNYRSNKAQQLTANPAAACSFWWPELERQIRLRGAVRQVSREESESYFRTRPRESQIGAWASDQSKELSKRAELERQFEEFEKMFKGKPVPVPEHWGGYRIDLEEVEFWQGRPGRLHDRILFARVDSEWKRQRLSP